MKSKVIGLGVGVCVVAAVLFPPLLYILIGVLLAWGVAVIYIVASGLNGEAQNRLIKAEVLRQVQGHALRRALVRREAAHLAAVEEAKNDLQAER